MSKARGTLFGFVLALGACAALPVLGHGFGEAGHAAKQAQDEAFGAPVNGGGAVDGDVLQFDSASGSWVSGMVDGGSLDVSFFQVGDSTDAVANGDLSAGNTASGGLFYDGSTKYLTIGDCWIREDQGAYRTIDGTASFAAPAVQLYAGSPTNAAFPNGGDVYIYSGDGHVGGSGNAGVVQVGGSTIRGSTTAHVAMVGNRADDGATRAGQLELQGGDHTQVGTPTNGIGGDVLIRGGRANGTATSDGGDVYVGGGQAVGGTETVGSVYIGTTFTSKETTSPGSFKWTSAAGNDTNAASPFVFVGDENTTTQVKGLTNVAGTDNGAYFGIRHVEELLTLTGSTTTTTISCPANHTLIGISGRMVVTAGGGTTSMDIGNGGGGGAARIYGDDIGITAGSTFSSADSTSSTESYSTSAQTITFTANGTNFDGSGQVRIAIFYRVTVAPSQ